MHAKNFVVNKCSNRHAVKNVLKLLPDSNAVSALAFIVEPINSVDLPAFVVSAQKEEVLFVFKLICKQQDNGLKTLLATVNIVTQE